MFAIDIRTAFMVLLVAVHIFGDSASSHHSHHSNAESAHTSNSTNTTESSSLDVSAHGSKLIQPVPLVADHPHQVISGQSDNFTQLMRLQDVLMVFDLNELAAKWAKIHHEFKSECAHDMTEYFRGLQQHKMWAIKSKLLPWASIIVVIIGRFLYFIANSMSKREKKQKQNRRRKK